MADGNKISLLEGIGQIAPLIMAGLSKAPSAVNSVIGMQNEIQKRNQQERIRNFGRAVFGGNADPSKITPETIFKAAQEADVSPEEAMTLVSKFMDYRKTSRGEKLPISMRAPDGSGTVTREVYESELPEFLKTNPGAIQGKVDRDTLIPTEKGYVPEGEARGLNPYQAPKELDPFTEMKMQYYQNNPGALAADLDPRVMLGLRASMMGGGGSSGGGGGGGGGSSSPKPLTTIGKLLEERNRYPEGSEERKYIDMAIQKATSSSNGISISTPGGPTVQIGGSGGGQTQNMGLTTPSKNELQKDLISTDMTLDRIESATKDYDPFSLTYPGKILSKVLTTADQAMIPLPENALKFIDQDTAFKTNIGREFDQYKHDITGAAAVQTEMDRLMSHYINEDQSPRQFKAAEAALVTALRRGQRLRRKFLREGVPIGEQYDSAWKSGQDDDIDARGNELEKSGMNEEQVKAQLKKEGYF